MTTDLNIDLFNNLRLELRRGLLIVAVLAQLRKEHYGYSLRTDLAALGMEMDEGTLYPLLRRLESQGLLESEWREENNRQKRFYKLSRDGRQILKLLLTELEKINASLTRII
jgi:PadR family transcriptional regulator PadR